MDKRKKENMRVRKSITKAFFDLMQTKNVADITITEIVESAGVARASFYRNYSKKEDIIIGLLLDATERFRAGREVEAIDYKKRSYPKKFFWYIKLYSKYIVDLHNANLSTLALEEFNNFQASIAGNMSVNSIEKYSIYFYMGALYNMAEQWVLTGTKESLDDITDVFCRHMGIK